MIQHYVKRGYPLKSLKKHMLRAARYSQKYLLTVKTKQEIKTPVMVTKYNPMNPDIRGFIHNIIGISLNTVMTAFTHSGTNQ